MKTLHRGERAAMYDAHRGESHDIFGNQFEEMRKMANRHEKAIADLQAKQEREVAGAPRWRKV